MDQIWIKKISYLVHGIVQRLQIGKDDFISKHTKSAKRNLYSVENDVENGNKVENGDGEGYHRLRLVLKMGTIFKLGILMIFNSTYRMGCSPNKI